MIKTYEKVPTNLGEATIILDDEKEMATIFVQSEMRTWEIPIPLVEALHTQIQDNKDYGTSSPR